MELKLDAFGAFGEDWALLTAGTPGDCNAMTISWGELGTLWGLPVATVYVKPVRYTHSFMEKSDVFTITFFPKAYRDALMLLGTRSGRDGDKIAEAGLTPVPAGEGVGFAEATTTIVCRKIYRQDLDLSAIAEKGALRHYETEAPHTMYIGKVLEVMKKE